MALAVNLSAGDVPAMNPLAHEEPERFNSEDVLVKQMQIKDELLNICLQNEEMMNKVNENITKGQSRIIYPMSIFDQLIPDFSSKLCRDPSIYVPAVDAMTKELYKETNAAHELLYKVRAGFSGWMAGHTITPRGLRPKLLNKLICVEGIVTRASTVKPKMVRSVHLAEVSGSYITRDYFDQQSLTGGGDANTMLPASDVDGNAYRMEVGLSTFIDFQRLVIQEMPENAPTGQLPCSVDILLEADLVDKCKAGDRVAIWGVYKALPRKEQQTVVGYSSTFLLANNVELIGGATLTYDLKPDDVKLMKQIAGRRDTLKHLAYSISPAICGGIEKKKGLLLQLIGGTRKILENGTVKVRGDIHVLLIGDPSCGKSQMLRFMMNASPLALSTTGRGSSGVGLTAAVVIDKDTGARRLEAGAMVMADGGLVCIDEFDKMVHEDRVAIHEVMEQQTVSIAKAGIQTTLNARCSVLAAANPSFGCFDERKDINGQISFPDSLMSRFDLIYLVHDTQSSQEDRKIARTVIGHHSIREHSETMMVDSNFEGAVDRTEWVVQPRGDPNATTSNFARNSGDGHIVYSLPFIKKYVQVAQKLEPQLTQEAIDSIADFYINLRKKASASGGKKSKFATPTARTLEACIRLSTAHAKLRLKETIDRNDVKEAKSLLTYTLLGEQYESDEEEELPMILAPEVPAKANAKKDRKKKVTESVEKVAQKMGHTSKRRRETDTGEILEPRLAEVPDQSIYRALLAYTADLKEKNADSVPIVDFIHGFHDRHDGRIEQTKETYLKHLEQNGKIMLVDDEIWLI